MDISWLLGVNIFNEPFASMWDPKAYVGRRSIGQIYRGVKQFLSGEFDRRERERIARLNMNKKKKDLDAEEYMRRRQTRVMSLRGKQAFFEKKSQDRKLDRKQSALKLLRDRGVSTTIDADSQALEERMDVMFQEDNQEHTYDSDDSDF